MIDVMIVVLKIEGENLLIGEHHIEWRETQQVNF